ncbi:MAG TPA: radical SAM-associated putative lipoprotein [Spirochaetota bacterium]|nr:radical SAM-associated putative lipoprotein [Spirochaetota bacterium]HPP03877.1 radical SAM-associated putative lipoprotein [Spirochaetota bacterium]
MASISGLIISLFGMGCPGIVAEYGAPYANYKLKGVVRNKENASPIKLIQIQSKTDYYLYFDKTVKSDENGHYLIEYKGIVLEKIILKIQDMDGEENGKFVSMDLTVDFSDVSYKDGNRWFLGTKEKEVDIELTPEN